jgi:hypothetical protein
MHNARSEPPSARSPRQNAEARNRQLWVRRSMRSSGELGKDGVTAEEWVLAATAFLSGLASGLLGMLSTIMRPMLAAMDGRDFRNFMEVFLRYAGNSWGKVFNFAWSIGMTIGPIVALVLLWPGSAG